MHADELYTKDYFHQGKNNKLVFFIHGIYSCPAQFEMFYPHLKEKGYSIYGILLKGHGDELRKLAKVKYHEWNKQISELLSQFKKQYDDVIVIGHSMGGLLALDTDDALLTKRILIAPAMKVRVTWRFIKLGINIDKMDVKDTYTESNRKIVGTQFPKGILRKLLTLFSFWQLFKLIKFTDINLSHIKKPILIIQSFNDECVSIKAPKKIVKNVSSIEKKILWLKKSYHGIFEPLEEELMIKEVLYFIEN